MKKVGGDGELFYFCHVKFEKGNMDLKRTASKHEAMRLRILAIAAGVFQRFGFSKTTMEDIAHGIHRRKSTLYYYFQSKEDVFAAVVDKELEAQVESVKELEARGLSPYDTIYQHGVDRLESARREHQMIMRSGLEDDRMQAVIATARGRYMEIEHEFLLRLFRRDAAALTVSDAELSVLATLAQAGLRKLEDLATAPTGEERPIEEMITRWIAFLWHGISGYHAAMHGENLIIDKNIN